MYIYIYICICYFCIGGGFIGEKALGKFELSEHIPCMNKLL